MVEKALQCECGFEARGDGESGLVDAIRRHAWDAHGMALSRDEALLLGFRAELDATRIVEATSFGEEKT